MNQITKSKSQSKPASTEAVAFTDGMLVTADDLDAAMRYPLSVVQVLLRSYFGCGIVCGLEVSAPKGSFVAKIASGVALGCDGYPIELCGELTLNLSPDPCACPDDQESVKFIAVRRQAAAGAAPRAACGCGAAAGDGAQQCTRLQDHIIVQAFDDPRGACMRPPKREMESDGCDPPTPHEEGRRADTVCQCLKQCPDCDRCAEPWVVVAVLKIGKDGIVFESINNPALVEESGGPRWVKPIACICASETRLEQRLEALEKRVRELTAGAGRPRGGVPDPDPKSEPGAEPKAEREAEPAPDPAPDPKAAGPQDVAAA